MISARRVSRIIEVVFLYEISDFPEISRDLSFTLTRDSGFTRRFPLAQKFRTVEESTGLSRKSKTNAEIKRYSEKCVPFFPFVRLPFLALSSHSANYFSGGTYLLCSYVSSDSHWNSYSYSCTYSCSHVHSYSYSYTYWYVWSRGKPSTWLPRGGLQRSPATTPNGAKKLAKCEHSIFHVFSGLTERRICRK